MTYRKRAPFGTATKRFATIGFHPGLDTTGCLIGNKTKLGPGHYNPVRFECRYKKDSGAKSRYILICTDFKSRYYDGKSELN